MNLKVWRTILAHALIGWTLCAATMGIGMAVTSIEITLIVHLLGAPVFFFFVSRNYFRKYNYTSALKTAGMFLGFVILVDFLIVALMINGSLEMFASPMGTWLPFLFIFTSTYMTGLYLNKKVSPITPQETL